MSDDHNICLELHTSNTAKYIFQLRKAVQQRFVLIILKKAQITTYVYIIPT